MKIDTIIKILECVKKQKPKRMELSFLIRINYETIKSYIKYMDIKGLVKVDDKKISITPKGVKLIALWTK